MDDRELLIKQMRSENIRCKGSSTADKAELKTFFNKIGESAYKDTEIFDKGSSYKSMKHNNSNWSGSDTKYTITINKFLKTYGHLTAPILVVPQPAVPVWGLSDLKSISIIPNDDSTYTLKDLQKCLENLGQETVFSTSIPFEEPRTIELRDKGDGDNERWAIEDRLQHKDNIQVTIDDFINAFSKHKKKAKDIDKATIIYSPKSAHTTTDLRDFLEHRKEIVGFNSSFSLESGDTIEKDKDGNWLFHNELQHSGNVKYTLDEFIGTFSTFLDPKKVNIKFNSATRDELAGLGDCIKKLGHKFIFNISYSLSKPYFIRYDDDRNEWRADEKPYHSEYPNYSIHNFIDTFSNAVPNTTTSIQNSAITFSQASAVELKELGNFFRLIGQSTVFNESMNKKSYRSIEFINNTWTMHTSVQNDDHTIYSIEDFISTFSGGSAPATRPFQSKPMRDYVISRAGTTQTDLTELKKCLKNHGDKTTHFSDVSQWTATHYIKKEDKWVGTKKDSNISMQDFLAMFGTRGITTNATNINIPTEPVKPKAKPKPILWKNPKPKIKNTREITIGDRVLINGKSVTCTASTFIDDEVNVQIANKGMPTTTELFNKEDVYPLYKIEATTDAKMGDLVILFGDNSAGIITKVNKETELKVFVNNSWYELHAISTLYSLIPPVRIYKKFACGTLEYNGREFQTIDDMKAANIGMKFKATNVENSMEHAQIAKHYSMDITNVIPKETEIMATLKTTLDHPLNVAQKEWALMYGGSGSGKTRVCVDYAKSAGRDYVLQQGSQQLTVDDLVGYKSITDGTYFPSLLRDAVENGKIYILDEMDACNPNTLLALNSLKQDEYQFPDKLIPIHKNFRLLATANTLEYSEEYNARSPLDKATRARFKTIKYDMAEHELALRYGLKYVKQIKKIDRLTPRDVARDVVALRIQED